MKWSNNFHILWPNLTKCLCCSFHKKKPGMISMKMVAVSIAQYHIMGNTQDQKTQYFNLFQYKGKSNMFALEIQTLHCKLKPRVNRLNLICPMLNTNFLLSFFPHFSYFPVFSWFLQNFCLTPGTDLLKLCSPKEKIETPASQRNPYFHFLLKGYGLMLALLIFVTSNLCYKTTLKRNYIHCAWKIISSYY